MSKILESEKMLDFLPEVDFYSMKYAIHSILPTAISYFDLIGLSAQVHITFIKGFEKYPKTWPRRIFFYDYPLSDFDERLRLDLVGRLSSARTNSGRDCLSFDKWFQQNLRNKMPIFNKETKALVEARSAKHILADWYLEKRRRRPKWSSIQEDHLCFQDNVFTEVSDDFRHLMEVAQFSTIERYLEDVSLDLIKELSYYRYM